MKIGKGLLIHFEQIEHIILFSVGFSQEIIGEGLQGQELIQYLIKAAGYGSNLLLNVGPMPNGEIQEEHIKSLKKIGEWVGENGETIYGTRKGPLNPTDELVSTIKVSG